MNDLFDDAIELDVAAGVYRLRSKPTVELRRCTEFVESFFEPFREYKVARDLVGRIPKYRGRRPSSLVAEWRRAKEEGTRVHGEIELALRKDIAPQNRRSQEALRWLERTFPRSEYEYLVECIVYSEDVLLAGTVDLLVRSRSNSDDMVLVDWKTSKKIERVPYQGKRGIRGPGRRLGDCRYIRYGLQLSVYRYILETCYGLNPSKLLLAHLSHRGVSPIECEYQRSTVVAMLESDARSDHSVGTTAE